MSSQENEKPSVVKCPACDATWINGQLYWATGTQGRDIDLAGLVCNMLETVNPDKAQKCINQCKGNEGGDTWENRLKQTTEDLDRKMKEQ